jgi:AraC family transcriptional regulator of adaptative response / DNA-3-methyladenine glycosylase II
VIDDPDRCYRAVCSRDSRFDGVFFTGVTSTGIYCRPSCPAMTPKRANVRFYATAAAAQAAGFRACRRCRPDATPGSPEWDQRADLVGRAMRLIADGVVDREGVAGLASRLGYSERHVNRQLTDVVGAGPIALARAQRAQTARVLIETTDLPFADVAFASGFASIRQFNDTVRTVYARSPTELRRRRVRTDVSTPGAISVRLAVRSPFDGAGLVEFLAARAIPGVEEVVGTTYRRTLGLTHGTGTVELSPAAAHVRATLRLDDLRDLAAAVARCRRLLDLDADPVAVAEHLGSDPLLAPLVAKDPGRRVPGTTDGFELAVRAILGQQVSVAGARTLAARLVLAAGEPLPVPDGGLTHVFPRADALAAAPDAAFSLPVLRRDTLREMASAVAGGDLDLEPGSDREDTRRRLEARPGIGPWTAGYVAMRALGDPDVFLATDLGVRHALEHLGSWSDAPGAAAMAERWSPWRSYALVHLWATLTGPEGRPTGTPPSASPHDRARTATRRIGARPPAQVASTRSALPARRTAP